MVGVMTAEADCRPLLSCASVSVACETYSGAPEESECVPVLRRESDVLVPRASERGGGLGSIAYAIDVLRETSVRIKMFFACFFALRILQAAFIAFSLTVGIGAIPPVLLLYVTLIADCVLLAQTLQISNCTKKTGLASRVDLQNPSAFFRTKHLWLSSIIPALGLIPIVAILYHIGVLSLGNSYALIVLGMMFSEAALMLRGIRGKRLEKRSVIRLILLIMPVILLLVLSALIPAVGELTELGDWNWAGVATLSAIPALVLVSLLMAGKENRGN